MVNKLFNDVVYITKRGHTVHRWLKKYEFYYKNSCNKIINLDFCDV